MNYSFDNCDVTKLAAQYKTPLYVISERMIQERIDELKQVFLNAFPHTAVAYASKAFLNTAMIQKLIANDLHLDVVSGGELYAAMHAGFDPAKIFFHGNNKSYDELEMALEHGVGRIVVDNLHELMWLRTLAAEKQKTVDILFRINPDVKGETHASISTGQADSKFGVSLDWHSLKPVIASVLTDPYLNLKGFHFHIGSQLMDGRGQEKAIDVTFGLIAACLKELDFQIEDLNIGGGFGIRYTEKDHPPQIETVLKPLMAQIDAHCEKLSIQRPRIIIEPGRWIVGEAGITLYTVGAIKDIPGIRAYLSVDGGMVDNLRPALYDAKYEALIANRLGAENDTLYTVAGKCCESGDVIIKDIRLPKSTYGDTLVVFSTGAYHYSMSNNYNKLRKPAVVFTNDGQHRLVTRRETYEDLVRTDGEWEGLVVSG